MTTQTQQNTFGSVRQEGQVRMNAVFKKHGAFFAYSGDQMQKGLIDNGIENKAELTSLTTGLYIQKSKAGDFIKEFEEVTEFNNKELIDKVGIEGIIRYELHNHESCYTYSTESATDALEEYGITDKDLINKIFNQELANSDY